MGVVVIPMFDLSRYKMPLWVGLPLAFCALALIVGMWIRWWFKP